MIINKRIITCKIKEDFELMVNELDNMRRIYIKKESKMKIKLLTKNSIKLMNQMEKIKIKYNLS